MPLYDYKCKSCKKVIEEYFEIGQSPQILKCNCGGLASWLPTPVGFINDFHDSYYDHGLGCVINSRQERSRVMREKGLTEVGNERKYVDPAKARQQIEDKFDKELEGVKKEALKALDGD